MLDDGAGTLSPALATAMITALADAVPSVSRGGDYQRTQRAISSAYEQTLSALPLPGLASEALAAIELNKAEARAIFEQAGRCSPSTGLDYRAVTVMPARWYDPDADIWTRVASSARAASAPAVTSAPAPLKPSWKWKVLSAAERLRIKGLLRGALFTSGVAAGSPAAQPVSAGAGLPLHVGAGDRRTEEADVTLVDPRGVAHIHPRIMNRSDLILREAEQPKPVDATPATLDITFEACVITLGRPWIRWPWLETHGWYIPGCRSGELTDDDKGEHPVDYTPPLHRLPVSAILVRNLDLSSHGMGPDELKNAVSFGPFQFIGHELSIKPDGNSFAVSVACPTPQLVAWVTQRLTGLPPETDPSVSDS